MGKVRLTFVVRFREGVCACVILARDATDTGLTISSFFLVPVVQRDEVAALDSDRRGSSCARFGVMQ